MHEERDATARQNGKRTERYEISSSFNLQTYGAETTNLNQSLFTKYCGIIILKREALEAILVIQNHKKN